MDVGCLSLLGYDDQWLRVTSCFWKASLFKCGKTATAHTTSLSQLSIAGKALQVTNVSYKRQEIVRQC